MSNINAHIPEYKFLFKCKLHIFVFSFLSVVSPLFFSVLWKPLVMVNDGWENEKRSTWLPLSPLSGAAGCYHGCNESSFISILAPSHHSQQDCSSSEMRIRVCCLADAHACVCRRMDVWNVLSHALTCWCCDRPWSDWCRKQNNLIWPVGFFSTLNEEDDSPLIVCLPTWSLVGCV